MVKVPPFELLQDVTSNYNNRNIFAKTLKNLRKIVILGPILFFQTIFFGQVSNDPLSIDSLNAFQVKVDSLIKSGLDTFFVHHAYCYSDGYFFPDNFTPEQVHEGECESSPTTYIFYRFRGANYVAKINDCFKYTPVKLKESSTFLFFFSHFTELINDTVKDASVLAKDGTVSKVGIDHSCYRKIYFAMNNRNRFFYIDLYDFREDVYTGKNIHYRHNMRTRIKKFLDSVTKETENLKFPQRETRAKSGK